MSHVLRTYDRMFKNYPDVVNVEQMCEMLGGICTKTAYKLLQANEINHFRIGKTYKIPKSDIITYLCSILSVPSALEYNALKH